MSHQAFNWAKAQELKAPAKPVLLLIADYANSEGEAFPSLTRIASELGYAKSTVQNAIIALREGDFLTTEQRQRTNNAGWTSTLYRLPVGAGPGDGKEPCPEAVEAIPPSGNEPLPNPPVSEPSIEPPLDEIARKTLNGLGEGLGEGDLLTLADLFRRIERQKRLHPQKRLQAQKEARRFHEELQSGDGRIDDELIQDPMSFFVGRLQAMGIFPKSRRKKRR